MSSRSQEQPARGRGVVVLNSLGQEKSRSTEKIYTQGGEKRIQSVLEPGDRLRIPNGQLVGIGSNPAKDYIGTLEPVAYIRLAGKGGAVLPPIAMEFNASAEGKTPQLSDLALEENSATRFYYGVPEGKGIRLKTIDELTYEDRNRGSAGVDLVIKHQNPDGSNDLHRFKNVHSDGESSDWLYIKQ